MNSEIAYLLYQRLLLVQSGTVPTSCEGQYILRQQVKEINSALFRTHAYLPTNKLASNARIATKKIEFLYQ